MELHQKRRGIYVATAIVLLGGGFLLRNVEWQGSTSLHTLMELAATLLAAFVGTMALVRFFSRRDALFLYIGTGFLGTAMLDGFHAVVTSVYFQPYMPSDNPHLVPWSWIASRLFLSIWLFVSWLLWFRHRNEVSFKPNTKTVMFASALATVTSFVFFATVSLPAITIAGAMVSRPAELLPAIFFLMALTGYLYKGAWRDDPFEHWLVLSIIVGVATQTAFMPLSGHLYDTPFNLAHLLKKLSYLLVLTGLLVSLYRTYKDLQEEIEKRKAGEVALRESHEQLHSLLDSMAEGAYGIGNEGKCTFANRSFLKILNYQSVDEVIGKQMHELIHHSRADGSPYPSSECKIHHTSQSIQSVNVSDEVFWRRDGHSFPVEYWSNPIVVDGVVAGSILTFIDITERKRMDGELRRYRDHLEEEVQQRTTELVLARNAAEAADRAKSVFLSSMSHEFRTPLNAILGFSSMMRKNALLPRELHDTLDIINRSGENLLTLINDVLEMSRIEAGRMQLEIAPFDLGMLVRDVTDMMHMRAQQKGLQLLIDQSSEFPRYIKGDEARLRQVLINLVGNAVKFTGQGRIVLRFGLKPNAMPQHLLIEVEDTGIGILPEDLQKIFEPFVQLEHTSTQTGAGLGLTITRQFVQLMGGTVSVDSTPGAGSVFRVELPVEKVAPSDVARPDGVVNGEIASLASGQPAYRILIVDDQMENQLLLGKLMESVGFQVMLAENGQQAIDLFQSWRPHLIWMDRRMPVMDGLAAARRIRELPGGTDVKIVAVTASAFAEQRDEIFKAGMDDFVRKPYRFNEIYACLTKQLGVQYAYKDAPVAEDVNGAPLTGQMLAGLPTELRSELRDALVSLEGERISAIIRQVASYDSTLHKTLSHLAENFDYPAILKALQS